jgi:hypothetical protein
VSQRRCIYCLCQKPVNEFNTEHVLNQAFGRFKNSLTVDCVCTTCNQEFGDSFDRKLARDSLEGIARVKDGLHPARAFKGEGARTTTMVRFEDGPLTGAHGRYAPLPGGNELGVAPLPQIGFARSPADVFEWWRLHEVPTKTEVAACLGLSCGDSLVIQIQGMPFETARALLETKGYENLPPVIELGRPNGNARTETIWIVGAPEFRAITKIAISYLACTVGPGIACMPQFNEARRFVTEGVEPAYSLVQATENPWAVDRNIDGAPAHGHYLAIQTIGEQLVVGQVSLLLRLRYIVTLARGGFSLPIDFSAAHFFDVDTKTVSQVSPPPLNPRG